MFSVALSLTFGAFLLALPASSAASNVAIAVCLVPEEDCVVSAVRAIGNPESENLVGAHGLTTGSGIR